MLPEAALNGRKERTEKFKTFLYFFPRLFTSFFVVPHKHSNQFNYCCMMGQSLFSYSTRSNDRIAIKHATPKTNTFQFISIMMFLVLIFYLDLPHMFIVNALTLAHNQVVKIDLFI